MARDDRGGNDAELKARLSALSGKLSEADRASEKATGEAPEDGVTGRAMSMGMRAMGELIAAVVFGAAAGWKLDQWFGTSPALLLGLLALGIVVGFWNVYRMAVRPTARPSGR